MMNILGFYIKMITDKRLTVENSIIPKLILDINGVPLYIDSVANLSSILGKINSYSWHCVLSTLASQRTCLDECSKRLTNFILLNARPFSPHLERVYMKTRTISAMDIPRQSLGTNFTSEHYPLISQCSAIFATFRTSLYENTGTTNLSVHIIKYTKNLNILHHVARGVNVPKKIICSIKAKTHQCNMLLGHIGAAGSSSLSKKNCILKTGKQKSPQCPAERLQERTFDNFCVSYDEPCSSKSLQVVFFIEIEETGALKWSGNFEIGQGILNFLYNFLHFNLPNGNALEKSGKRVSFSESVEVTEVENVVGGEEVTGEVDEETIDKLLHVLHEADPTGERPDDPTMAHLEESVNAMAPTIDAELEKIDRTHAELARLSTDLVGSLNLYHQLMREMPPMGYYGMGGKGPGAIPGQMPPGFGPPPGPGMPPHQMYGNGGQFMPYMGGPPGPGGPMSYGGIPPPGHIGMPPHMQHMPNASQPPNIGGPPVSGQPPVPGQPPIPGQPAPLPHMDHNQTPQPNVQEAIGGVMGNYGQFPGPAGGAPFPPMGGGPQHNGGQLPPQHHHPSDHPSMGYNPAAFNQQQPMHQPLL
ncbi:unnamed protein product, partial [Meganyctiphanes norvegica]